MIGLSSISVPICNYFHARRVNSDKLTSFRGSPLSPLLS